jgi:hypothetical protein
MKLASLRDAISYALFNIPYSQAVFTERGGRLPQFDPLAPVFLGAAAARFGIAETDLGAWLGDAKYAGREALEIYVQMTVDERHAVDANGEIQARTYDEFGEPRRYPGRVHQLAVQALPKGKMWCRWWGHAPSSSEIAEAIADAVRSLGSEVAIVCSRDFRDALSDLGEELRERGVESSWRARKNPSENARSAQHGGADVLYWITCGMRDLGEGGFSENELEGAAGRVVEIPPQCDEPSDPHYLARLTLGKETIAGRICMARGRSPAIQRELREHVPRDSPQATLGNLPASVNAVEVVLDRLTLDSRWLYDEDLAAIAAYVQEWEETEDHERADVEWNLGLEVLSTLVAWSQALSLHSVTSMFGWKHAYSTLMENAASWVLSNGVWSDVFRTAQARNAAFALRSRSRRVDMVTTSTCSGAIRGAVLMMDVEQVGTGRGLKRVPLQEELGRLLANAGLGTAHFSRYVIRAREKDDKKVNSIVIELAVDVLAGRDRPHKCTQPKHKRDLSASVTPDIPSRFQPVVLTGGPEPGETVHFPSLNPWIEQVNDSLATWGAGYRLNGATIEALKERQHAFDQE